MKKAEISRNEKIEERIFPTMKFDRHNERERERWRSDKISRTIARMSFEFYKIYMMFDDDVRFRVSFTVALKRFHTRFIVQNRGHFLNCLCKSINMQYPGNFFDNKN